MLPNTVDDDVTVELVGDLAVAMTPPTAVPLCGVDTLSGTSSQPGLGNAFDLIVVVGDGDRIACGDLLFRFDPAVVGPSAAAAAMAASARLGLAREASTRALVVAGESRYHIVLQVHDHRIPISGNRLQTPLGSNSSPLKCEMRRGSGPDDHAVSALTLLAKLAPGRHRARYLLLNDDNVVVAGAPMHVHRWSSADRVSVVDIDGTITRSNLRGVVDTILTSEYRHCHTGVCDFLTSLSSRIVYLTSRPIALANTTAKFLKELRQVNAQLPAGALLGFAGTLGEVLYMELVSKSVHQFKAAALEHQVRRPFRQVGVDHVLQAGFGNTLMDVEAYHQAGLRGDQIYLIDKQSRIYCLDRPHAKLWHRRGTSFHGYDDLELSVHVSKRKEEPEEVPSAVWTEDGSSSLG